MVFTTATTVLKEHNIKYGSHVTSYPSFKGELEHEYKYDDHSRVVTDGHLITSRGPGTALEFSLAIVELVQGKAAADKLAAGMIVLGH